MTLIRQQWRRDRSTVVAWAVAVVFLTWLVGAMYDMLVETGTLAEFEQLMRSLPPAARALMGAGNLAFLDTFVAGIEYGGIMSIVFIVFLTTYVPGLISQEIDRGNSEFLLSLPLKRQTVLATKWLGLALSTAILAAVQWVALLAVTGRQAQPVRYLWATANMYLLYLGAGTLLLLASIFIDDYPRSTGVCAGIITGLFFFDAMTEETTGIASTIREALPFARFDANAILSTGKVPLTDMAVLAAVTAAFFYLSIRAFDAKQIPG